MAVKFARHSLNLLAANWCVPNQAVSNQQLLAQLSDRCGWRMARKAHIFAKRLGVEQRYFSRNFAQPRSQASPNGVSMAKQVIEQCLSEAGLEPNQLSYLLTHTCTPHTQVPPNAAWLADQLAYHGAYLELRQACTGFANCLQMASALCAADQQPVAIVGSETGSVYFDLAPHFVDQQQLVNFVQMGDGCGGVIVAPAKQARGLIKDIYLGQIGHQKEPGFYLDAGADTVGEAQMARFHHNSNAVRETGSQLFELGLKAVLERGYQLRDFRYILPHQANGHIDKLLSKALAYPQQQIINDAKHFGNLGSAAIWLSFARLLQTKPLEPGDQVLVLGAEATKYLYGGFVYQH
ncbi:3-oxoacyl-ACP synthase [Agarivorans sp. TSD2052]|uniref:3-oxoacyl-ACP synthase III family protein n=1 Tax=Agarivorans sp. TSD2052 TaxID=2937286 RepID=UPI00200DD98E|nr:3-oxoacyl-[acyl-carrier-protein] synthase III C-terminal domain-containing protein [Agarivorans sp. TSD2052]UPW19518.1 3-oxoacyl-ACP synthase [Agarivorans sp. TSD2052]